MQILSIKEWVNWNEIMENHLFIFLLANCAICSNDKIILQKFNKLLFLVNLKTNVLAKFKSFAEQR